MNGKFGMRVKRNKQAVGTDMIKLKEIAEALSVKSGILKLRPKFFNTENKVMP